MFPGQAFSGNHGKSLGRAPGSPVGKPAFVPMSPARYAETALDQAKGVSICWIPAGRASFFSGDITMRTLFMILAGSLLASATSQAGAPLRTFYVDAAGGDDARDGLNAQSAWRSLARVNRASLAPGDRVLFRRGQTWRGQLVPRSGDAGGVITYGAFGEGDKPILLGSVAADRAEDWQPAGERLWETKSLRHEPFGEAIDLAPERRSVDQEGGALPADGTAVPRPERIRQPRHTQATPLSVDVGNIIFDHGKTTGVKKWKVDDLRRDGDFVYDPRSWQVRLRSDVNPATRFQSIELALRRHIIDQSGRGYVNYENLDLRYGAAHGIGGGSTHHITIRGCDISYIGGGHQFTRPDGSPVRFGNGIEFWADARDGLVEECRIWEIYDAALTNQGSGTNVQENITYRRNVIWNSEYSFEYWNRGPASRTQNILFEHNTCVDAGFGWGHTQRPDPNGRHLMFYDNTAATAQVVIRNNVFCNATDSLLCLHGRDWTAALTMDSNCWFQPHGPWALWGKEIVDARAFSAFMGARGLDLHSVQADPKFADPARRDYRLAADSPARALAGQAKPAGALP